MEEGDKVISPELIKIRSEMNEKQININSAEKELKSLSKKLDAEKNIESKESIRNDMDSLSNLIEKFENEYQTLNDHGINIFQKQQESKAFQAPEVKAQIEARNIAHNKIERLQIERDLKTKPLNAKIEKLNSSKSDKSDEVKKLQAKVSKIDQDFNKLIEAQQSIIQQN
jgi:DNA repair exonuclease SbcCD ATPase subunit